MPNWCLFVCRKPAHFAHEIADTNNIEQKGGQNMKMKGKISRELVSVLLVLAMLLSFLPTAALAAENDAGKSTLQT